LPILLSLAAFSAVICLEVDVAPPKNVTVLIYLIKKRPFLQNLPYVGPGFDVGVEDVNEKYGSHLQISQQYISLPKIISCVELGANYHLIVYYY
jgi:hypothetical protein